MAEIASESPQRTPIHENLASNTTDVGKSHQEHQTETAANIIKPKPRSPLNRLYTSIMECEITYDAKDSQTYNSEAKFTQTPKDKPIKIMTPRTRTAIRINNNSSKSPNILNIPMNNPQIMETEEHSLDTIPPITALNNTQDFKYGLKIEPQEDHDTIKSHPIEIESPRNFGFISPTTHTGNTQEIQTETLQNEQANIIETEQTNPRTNIKIEPFPMSHPY